MIETLSPFTRRLLALALLFVAIVSILNLVLLPVWGLFRNSLGRLGDARFQRVQVEAVAARAPPVGGPAVPRSLYTEAVTREAAVMRLAEAIRAEVAAAGLTSTALNTLPPDPRTGNVIAVSLAVEGSEGALLRLISRLEQSRPLKRLAEWRISRAADGTRPGAAPLRLEARVLSAWARR